MLRALVVVLLLASAWESAALDQPVSARKLIMRRTASGQEKLAFLTKDGAIPFPALDSANDPASGTPGGVIIEMFTENGGMATLSVPAAVGWLTRDGSPAFYKFVNKLAPGGVSPVSSLLLKSGRAIRLRAEATGLPLTGALGTIGIRFTMGSLRICALFDASTIERDEGRAFLARDAVTDGLVDCSNASLGGPTCAETADAPTCGGTCPPGSACGTRDLATCECVAAAQPCGDTYPVCNGECPVGDECGSIGGFPVPQCGCVAATSTPCGNTFATCDGSCPTGLTCYPDSLVLPIGSFDFCQCLSAPPTDACGGCPAGAQCVGPPILPTLSCVPRPCGGGFPTCGPEGCPAGSSCQALPGLSTCGCLP